MTGTSTPEPMPDERLAEVRKYADSGNLSGREARELLAEVTRLRAVETKPRPFLRAAIDAVTPEMMKHFEEAWAKAMAEWDGKLVVLPPREELRVEFGMRVTYVGGSTFEGPLSDTADDAREAIAAPDADDAEDETSYVVSRELVWRKASEWREVPDDGQ